MQFDIYFTQLSQVLCKPLNKEGNTCLSKKVSLWLKRTNKKTYMNQDWTMIIRPHHSPKTVISEEYSTEYKDGMEPYYPVNDDRNNALADTYRKLAAKEENTIFGGRLAEYKYYDMAPIVEKVLSLDI